METQTMDRQVTVTLPEALAARLDQEADPSAFVAEAVDDRMRREELWEMLRKSGYVPTPESRARARKKLDDARARVTPESIAESRRRLREITGEAS
jgi:glutamine synthetase adenylyltransferase